MDLVYTVKYAETLRQSSKSFDLHCAIFKVCECMLARTRTAPIKNGQTIRKGGPDAQFVNFVPICLTKSTQHQFRSIVRVYYYDMLGGSRSMLKSEVPF